MKKRVTLLAGIILLSGLGLGLAQTRVVLNSTYVPYENPKGWVRVRDREEYKHVQDDAIAGHSLVKFDIHYIPAGATITSAKLWFFCQKDYANAIEIYRALDDSWNPDDPNHTPPILWDWAGVEPVSVLAGQAGWKFVEIATWVQAELGTTYLSIKFHAGDARIASPTAWYSLHRPKIEVEYTNALPLGPDLTVNRHDIAFSTMWPVPYEPVTITATVHNVGGQTTPTGFYVRFYDNGTPIPGDVWVNPIPGGGGTGTAQKTWNPTEGIHDIEVVADVFNNIQNEIREDNNSCYQNEGGQYYKFEVRGQYKYYVESFEGGFGRWRKDAEQDCDLSGNPQLWDVNTVYGSAYDGSYYLEMYLQTTFDNGTVWIERPIPIQDGPNPPSLLELSYFAHDGGGEHGKYPTRMWLGWYDPDCEFDFSTSGALSPPSWRRYRSCAFLNPPLKPEYWVGGGYRQSSTGGTEYDYFDLFTIRVDPPRSTTGIPGNPPHLGLATAYNNGTKYVWDGLSYHYLLYMSGDSIWCARSDANGDAFSSIEFIGLGQYPAIALDPDGYPRAVWRSANGRILYYSKRSTSGWSPPWQLIQYAAGDSVMPPSLAIDQATTIRGHVAYEHWTSNSSEIRYGYFDASTPTPPSFTTSRVYRVTSGRCQLPAITWNRNINNNYIPQIVYSRPPSGTQPDDIFFAERPGSTWQHFNVSQTSSIPDAHPHIANLNGSVQVVWSVNGDEIKHRARDGVVWGTITPVSSTTGLSDYPRILVPGYYVVWMDKTETLDPGGGPPHIWQTYYTNPATIPGNWNPAANIVPTYENSCYPQITSHQDLLGNTYYDFVHTEGDQSLYTLEISHKNPAPPPGGSGGMLLAVNADEAALGGSRALWKSVTFDVPRDLDINFAIAGSADNLDEMKLVLDDHDFGWNTPEAWNGSELRGQRKVVRFQEALRAGSHTLELHASGQPVFKGLRVWHGNVGGGPQSSGLVTDVPASTFLAQSFPNPTFGKATIAYGLAKEGPVKLSIYNALGQVVRELVSENQRPGFHRVEWDGKSQAGKQVTSGIYFYRLNAGGFSKTNKLVVVR